MSYQHHEEKPLKGDWSKPLTFQEPEEVLLDVEMIMNNRPLNLRNQYLQSTLLRGEAIPILEEDLENVREEDVNKRIRFLERSNHHL